LEAEHVSTFLRCNNDGRTKRSIALSQELPSAFVGNWYQDDPSKGQCSDDSYPIEIHSKKNKTEVSGGSFDTVCTWIDGRVIVSEKAKSKITGITSEMIVYSLKSQCEKIDDSKDRPGSSIITYVRQKIGEDIHDELYIGSAIDAYAGFYHRCKK
jgi:hypothetical protein